MIQPNILMPNLEIKWNGILIDAGLIFVAIWFNGSSAIMLFDSHRIKMMIVVVTTVKSHTV